MRRYALIGEKLQHSLSVPIHEAIFRETGFSAQYCLLEIPRADFAQKAGEILKAFDGLNVTMPYKQAVMPLIDKLDAAAEQIGSVNTVSNCGGVLTGYNTDAPGLAEMLRHSGLDPAGKTCFVLGTGGAARAAAYTARMMGAGQVYFVSRTPDGEDLSVISYNELDSLSRNTKGLLINATPVGMTPDTDACPLKEDMIAGFSGVADLIYNPLKTRLTQIAANAGIPAVTGLYMLVEQAVQAQKIWQEKEMPADLTPYLIKRLNLL